jgi:hypothetical protein
MPSGPAVQSPEFNLMNAHYAELAGTTLTALGTGEALYKAAKTTAVAPLLSTSIVR